MNAEEAAKLLEEKLSFESKTALAYVRARGHCEYCDRELILDRLGYACAQIDHLLPHALHEDRRITEKQENFTLSCSLCNGTKGASPILIEGEDPEIMLTNKRPELIERVRELIKDKLQESDSKWKQAKTIFTALDRDSLLLDFSFVTYMDRKDHTTENGKFMGLSDKIKEQICKVADEYELQVECYSSSISLLDEKNNCGRCVICNEWVSAQNKPNIKTKLGLGAEYEEKLFCQQHLPKESPMYSKLFPVWEREE